ncbi:hypothetical protein FHW16_005411 [Phyllobacterium myrsinacearum]|uniref:Uncharacterized protein n=1 Tax=Phyllobacterium myrsinacearum TaxID=28101 RepID=A0A839EWI0_9HYPH|nr:hypothetical protein [Phyllobacterium myrsinacearum]
MFSLYALARFFKWLFRPEFHPRCAYTRGYYSAISQQDFHSYPSPNPFIPGSDEFRDWNAGFADGLCEVLDSTSS